MFAPIFQAVAASAAATAFLGNSPTRLWPFGDAPEPTESGYALPYAVWQTVSGSPENYINQVPDIDAYTIQVDVYALTGSSARATAEALRDAIEPHAHIVGWRGESREKDTKLYRYSFDVDWLVKR
tara:strand:+ start:11139 stop:11516 length:378 start_codon:yes stop_codon:yes gene_type:complete